MAKVRRLYGDVDDGGTVGAGELSGTEIGGPQRLKGRAREEIELYGDATTLRDDAAGGRDKLFGRDGGEPGDPGYGVLLNTLFGDGFAMFDRAVGGKDKLVGGDNGRGNTLYGDARFMYDETRGGNDTLIGGDADDPGLSFGQDLYGDAGNMRDKARGGDDLIRLGSGFIGQQIACGDAFQIEGRVRCGDDTLIGGVGSQINLMYGDAKNSVGEADTKARFGNDVLISGAGTRDVMSGDAFRSSDEADRVGGNDTFVFQPGNGLDGIFDFEQGRDVIDLTALAAVGIHGIGDLTFVAGVGSVTIFFDAANQIAVSDVTALTAADFLFA